MRIVNCGSCQTKFQAPDHLAGKQVRCPSCSNIITLAPLTQSSVSQVPQRPVAPATNPPRPPRPGVQDKVVPLRPAGNNSEMRPLPGQDDSLVNQDPLGLGASPSSPQPQAAMQPQYTSRVGAGYQNRSKAPAQGMNVGLIVGVAAIGGGLLLVIGIIVVAMIIYATTSSGGSSNTTVAQNSNPTPITPNQGSVPNSSQFGSSPPRNTNSLNSNSPATTTSTPVPNNFGSGGTSNGSQASIPTTPMGNSPNGINNGFGGANSNSTGGPPVGIPGSGSIPSNPAGPGNVNSPSDPTANTNSGSNSTGANPASSVGSDNGTDAGKSSVSGPPGRGSSNSTRPDRAGSSSSSNSTKSTPTKTSGDAFSDVSTKWMSARSGEMKGAIPVEGEDLVVYHYSWMTRILPELGYQELYDRFDYKKPFHKGANLLHSRTIIPEFLNPQDDREFYDGNYFAGFGLTHFVGMAGIDSTRNSLAADLPRSDKNAGIFGYDEVASADQITDGQSQTILVIGGGLLSGPWICGGGATVRSAREPYFDNITGFGSKGLKTEGAIVMMADGSIHYLPKTINPQVFSALCTTHGGERVDEAELGAKQGDWINLPKVKPKARLSIPGLDDAKGSDNEN